MSSERPSRELGLPHFILLLLVPLIPLFLSGALRAGLADPLHLSQVFLDVSLSKCLALGVFITAVGVGWALTGIHVRPPAATTVVGSAGLFAVGAGLAWRTLYNPRFHGLVTVGGGDAGAHLTVRSYFVFQYPAAAKGETTFHAVTYWLERIFRLDAFGSFRLGFYLSVGILLLVLVAAVALAGREAAPRVWILTGGWFTALASLTLLPLLHYLQADGYYSQLFGLVPLFTCWVAYALARRPYTRLLVLLAWVGTTRFTYALNLGDVLIAAAILTILEARSMTRSPGRLVQWGFVVVFLAASTLAFAQFLQLWSSAGKVVVPIIALVFTGEALLALDLTLLPGIAKRRYIPLSSEQIRLGSFAVALALANLAFQLAYVLSGNASRYYAAKYGFHPVALLVAAAMILPPFVIPRIVTSTSLGQGGRWRARWMVKTLALACLMIAGGYQPYLRSFVERCRSHPPWRTIGPLVDREGTSRIAATLRAENRPFAGLLGSSWPMMHFMNADLGQPEVSLTRDWEELGRWVMQDRPGCLFWYGGIHEESLLERRRQPGAAVVLAKLRQLDTDPNKRCDSYPAHWDPERVLQLCRICGHHDAPSVPPNQAPSSHPLRTPANSGT